MQIDNFHLWREREKKMLWMSEKKYTYSMYRHIVFSPECRKKTRFNVDWLIDWCWRFKLKIINTNLHWLEPALQLYEFVVLQPYDILNDSQAQICTTSCLYLDGETFQVCTTHEIYKYIYLWTIAYLYQSNNKYSK